MKFTEEKLENAFTELLGNENFPQHFGITIKQNADEVLIEKDLQPFLLTQCKMVTRSGKCRIIVTEHIQNVFNEGRLNERVVCRNFRLSIQQES